jgi:GNAT superfamily N-acetyltransferase
MAITVEPLTGEALKAALPALGALRIRVFRDWPYLYDGTAAYEQEYLSHFAAAEGALIVAARDGDRIVGVATAAPLAGHTAEFVPLFTARGLDPDRVFYCGESVLLPEYRGHGLGHAFFDAREAHARELRGAKGPYTHATFCGVVRPADHPLRPAAYRPLDAFWEKRGYRKVDGLVGSYTWKDIDQDTETAKPMQFWMRPL